MRKLIYLQGIIVTSLITAAPVFAASADVSKIQSFITSIVGVLVTLASSVAIGFFVVGGIGYITSSGNPEQLDRSKRTIMYSAVGLAVVLGAYVLTTIISDLATTAFGSIPGQ